MSFLGSGFDSTFAGDGLVSTFAGDGFVSTFAGDGLKMVTLKSSSSKSYIAFLADCCVYFSSFGCFGSGDSILATFISGVFCSIFFSSTWTGYSFILTSS